MNNLTALIKKSRWLLPCLLLYFFIVFQLQAQCPPYPRAYDQVYICQNGDAVELGQKSSIHNPVRFTFNPLPSEVTMRLNFGDGNGWHFFNSDPPSMIEVTFPSEGQYLFQWQISHGIETCCDNNGEPYLVWTINEGSEWFQPNANAGVDYGDFQPAPYAGIISKPFTPPGGDPIVAQGIVSVLYANPDQQMRKPFILVEGFESSAAADPNPLPLLFLQNPTCSANISVPAIAPVSSIRIPTCGVPHDPHDDEFKQPGSDCILATGMTPNSPTVDEQFHLGSYMMRYDNFDAAIEALRPVAALWQPEMSTYTSNCQQYIKVSKAFIDANDASNLPRSGAAPKQAQASGSLLIIPNPANSVAIMHLSDEEHQLNVWDAQGRLVLQTSATGNS